MENEGLPRISRTDKRICLDLLMGMDKNMFSYLLRVLGERLSDSGIMDKERYRRILKEIFEIYGEEFYSSVVARDGEINFIALKDARYKSLRMAHTLSEEGRPVLVISQMHPKILIKRYAFAEKFEFRWLTKSDGENTIKPQLELVKKEIFRFIDTNNKSVIVLDAAEHLIDVEGFDGFFSLLWILQDRISTTESIILIPISPEALEKRYVEKIKRDFEFIE